MKVLFIDGTSGFSPYRLAQKASGGIITSLTLIPRYLAKKGVRAVVASEHPVREEVDGVLYTPTIEDADREADWVVFNRNIFNRQMESMFPKSKKAWWLHDIVDHRYMEDDSYQKMDKIVALSKYCQDSYTDYFGIDKKRFVVIPNGADKSLFRPDPMRLKDPHLYVCASATVKGLYPMSFAWHNILRHDPKAELRIYSSQKLHDREDGKAAKLQIEELQKGGARILDPIPQAELAQVFGSARALFMPNHYPEICSNLILQAQACGLPVVTTNIGSAGEFIKHRNTGMLTTRLPHDMFWWWKDFAEQAVAVQSDDALFRKISQEAPKKVFSWEEVGEKWLTLLKGEL